MGRHPKFSSDGANRDSGFYQSDAFSKLSTNIIRSSVQLGDGIDACVDAVLQLVTQFLTLMFQQNRVLAHKFASDCQRGANGTHRALRVPRSQIPQSCHSFIITVEQIL